MSDMTQGGGIIEAAAQGGFPLSPQQRRLWALHQADPAAPWRVQTMVRLDGDLDAARLLAAIGSVVARYEVLRTSFPCPLGMKEPLQVVGGPDFLWEHTSAPGGLSAAEREAWIESLWDGGAAVPPDLERGPVLAASLVTLEPNLHLLSLRLPALCADAASLVRLAFEVAEAYASVGGAGAEEPLQYADLASWQNELLDSADEGRAYWRRLEIGPSLAFALPFQAAGSRPGHAPGLIPLPLSADLAGALAQRAEVLGAPLSSLLLAGWLALLSRLSGEREIAIGVAFDGRSYDGLAEALGPLARYLPFPVTCNPALAFSSLVAEVQRRIGELYERQEFFCWEDLPGLGSLAAGYTAAFDFTELPPRRGTPDLGLTLERLSAGLERAGLRLSWTSREGALRGELHYDGAVLGRADALRIGGQLATLLAGAATAPETPLAGLPVLTPDERRWLLFDLNDTARPLPEEPVHGLFEAWADRTPEATALVFEEERLTFAGVEERANRLAHHLRALGVRSEVPVALLLPRSHEMVVAILAVLKAGGCYVPLDPGLPAERAALLLAETAAPVVICLGDPPPALAVSGVRLVRLDADAGELARRSSARPDFRIPPESAAYVLFTSGSTGRPKGVVVEHRQLVSYVAGVTERLDLPPGASYATVSSFAADLGNTAVFPALTTGGCLHVIAQERMSDPEEMTRYFELHAIDCLKIVPSHLEALQASARPERVMPRRRLVLGGEASRRGWIERVQALSPECRILNHYGPTETTVGVLTHEVDPAGTAGGAGVPLGRPLANARIYVLDPELEPAPAWVAGEIAIGGSSVARGYLGRPDLTAERFLPDPWSERPGSRLYRTGDLGRCREEGVFEFLGRIDDQVKIRGFRVEPGEIEAVLREHPAVRTAAVLVREDRPGHRRLVAYVATAPEEGASPADLTAFLAGRLPDFMVPAAVVILPRLPLNPNGKVDRQRLPAPEERGTAGYVAPRTVSERLLADLWAEVLGVERVGIEDSFFQLGGDSIRSISLRGRALEHGLDFSVAELFEHPTIAQLAALVAERAGLPATAVRRAAPFELLSEKDRASLPAGLEDAYPLTRLQAGMLFHSEYGAGTAIYHDIHSFHLQLPLDLPRLEQAAAELALRHPVLRTSFELSSFSEAVQLVHRAATIPVYMIDLRGIAAVRQEEQIAAWLVAERRRPLDWTRPPLMAFFIHRRSDDALQFTLSYHHSIVDGWSTASLTAELFSRYLALLEGVERPPEPPLAVTFRDFVALERQALASDEHREFWRRQLAGRSVNRLPRWIPGDANTPGEARAVSIPVAPGTSAGLKRLADAAGIPVKSIFLAAHLKVLATLCGDPDVTTGLISNGRPEEADGERVLGLFLNTVPLRLVLAPGRWVELARAAFRCEQALSPYRRYPLAELQRAEGGEPLFDTAFNYVHYHVYEGLLRTPELGVLGQDGYEETNFPLEANFSLSLADASVLFWLSYRTTDFNPGQIQSIAAYYLAVMREIAADPEAEHAAFCALSMAERHQISIEWNDSGRLWAEEPATWELIAAQAERTPEATAVIWRQERLSYRELMQRVAPTAARLAALGVGPGAVVAVLAERGLDFWLAALSVLAAGGAYLPLDPRHPAERQAHVVARSGALLALAAADLLPGFEQALGASPPRRVPLATLLADEGWAPVAPIRRAAPTDLAYVIYTSGSTGEPKGVMVEHRGMLNHLRAKVEDLALTENDTVAQTASQCFDISVWQFLAPLLVGGAVHILADDVAHEPRALLDVAGRGEVTILETVPSLLRLLLDEIEPQGRAALGALRWMIPTGEALAPELCRRWLAMSPVPLLNAFGPTECSDDVSHHRIDVPPAANAVSVPIGRPVANLRLHVLDRHLLPVPLAAVGELCVAGTGVGRGYLGEPARTAAVFVPDPFSAQPGARLYRTGDLGRWTPEGRLEFLGRLDHQVKIRGHRIELGEVEVALAAHPLVRQAVVVAREEPAGEKRLVAYLVPAEDGLQLAALRVFLEGRLPEAMVPSVFVVLSELPLTPNGKLDRRALPAPVEHDRLDAARPYAAPRTGEEEILAGVWGAVLRRELVGIHDDFFELGGDSLSATRAISRLRKLLGLELPLRTLFDAPTVASFAAKVGAFRRSGQGLALPPLQPAARGSGRRLSFAQERLWFIDQLEPGSSAYNIHRALRLGGPLDDRVLEICLREILRRHEALRTAFVAVGGVPSQVVRPIAGHVLPIVDLQLLPEPERTAEARRLADAEAYRPFDLARAPLVRSTLLRLAPDDCVVLVTMHHIGSDAWSMGLFIEELAALYQALSASRPSPLPVLPVQYADFAEWQRQWLQGEVLTSHLGYWRERLSGCPVLELHTDRPRPAMQSFRGADHEMALPGDLTREIKLLARGEGVTLFMVLLAAVQVLFRRYSGQEDIVVGTPIANRVMPELERLIGFFINTLALRTDLGGALSFRALLGRVREVSLGAYAHQDLPFEKIVEALQPERDLSRSPLFQVMLVLQNAPFPVPQVPDVHLRPWEVEQRNTRFDLEIMLSETAQGLQGSVTYATDLFDPPTIFRLVAHLEVLLRGAVADPDLLLSELPLLSEAETRQLREWNDTAARVPREALIHDLVSARAAEQPDAIALVEGEHRITYGELNRRAVGLAGELRSLGVGAEAVVGLLTERSTELVIGALAVLKAGGAYLPLDPSAPRERLAFMLRDAGVSAVLAKSPSAARLLAAGVPVVSLDGRPRCDLPVHDEPPGLTSPDHLAYVIYTSGSTGLPKGVEVSHRALLNLVFWHRRVFSVTPDDRATLVAGVAFDASVWEIWPYLSAGSSLYLPDEETRVSPARLRDWLIAQEATLSFLPTPLAESLFALEWQSRPALRAVLVGGDRLHFAPWSLPFEVVNNYGPTENAVVATSGIVNPGDVNPSIGRPLDNVKIHVLDAALQPVPVGVPGGLYLGGESLARGYRGRPDLTAARFLPDSFGSEPGSRLYETGDLVRLQPGGAVDFLGRLDEQLKIRGFRVEPGEVEAALEAHPHIQRAVVIGKETLAGDLTLVAYVMTRRNEPSPSALRAFLRERLPEYMVPAAFVRLEALPLTVNGKVDRRALSQIEVPEVRTPTGFAVPGNLIEEVLAGIWEEVLRVAPVGLQQNFFDLGGHSLLATQIVSRIRGAFGVEIPVRTLFEEPTVAGLAKAVDAARRADESPELPEIEPVPRGSVLPLSFAQARLWFLDQLDPGNSTYNLHVAVGLEGPLDIAILERSFTEVLRRHDVLRTTFVSLDGMPRQTISPLRPVALPLVDLCGMPAAEAESKARELAAADAQQPFDLARGPLLRIALVRLGTSRHVVLATMHHIVSDGWSMGILVREVSALYAAFQAGEGSPLPDLPIQYGDYALWQQRWLQGEVLARELEHWRSRLGGAPPVLELPTDRPRPAVQRFRGGRVSRRLPTLLGRALQALGRRRGSTLFMTLLAAFKVLLCRYTGQEDVVVGSPIAGRNRAETEGLIGFFVNTLVLRTDLSGDPTFLELAERVRETSLDAHSHQDLPFEKLVEHMQPERSLSHSPLFQVLFVLQNAMPREVVTSDLTMAPMETETGAAKFDLTLDVAESEAGLWLRLDYDVDLFDAPTVTRLLGHLEVLLAGIAADPARRLGELPLLSSGELQQIHEWSWTPFDQPCDICLHEMFERQVERTPDAVALVSESGRLTYRELDRRANRLARALRSLGVGPDVRVGLCVERASEMVWGILGVLKAGGAYVPLDPEYPDERLAFLIQDAGPQVLLTQTRLIGRTPWQGAPPLCLDMPDWAEGHGEEDDERPAGGATPDHLAYVIYTSGSTGLPKGSLIAHRGVANQLQWRQRCFPLGPADRVLQTDSFSFDPSLWQIFWPLSTGARLVLLRPGGNRDSRYLVRLLAEEEITVVGFVPSLLQVVLEEPELDRCRSLRHLFCGGEALRAELQCRFFTRLPAAELHNVYGPTEASIDATDATFRAPEEGRIRPIAPIGRAIGNKAVYVVDRCSSLAPVGVPGELWVGGVGLARGYLGRPELTAERFSPDPFAAVPGARLYRTGDLVRLLADGAIEFLGRIDHQVKVRGFRIELGEVEAALGGHPGVKECVVEVREDTPGAKRLVAYVVPKSTAPAVAGLAELRRYLEVKLPQHMVPSVFMILDALPLSPNGKVDRRALPAPDGARPELRQTYVAPRTPAERELAAIWSQVLGIDRVGIEDNFFDLGGDSILSIQIVSKASRAGLRITPRDVFQHQTVAELAAVAGHGPAAVAAQGVVTGELPLTPIQRWFFEREVAEPHHFNQSVLFEMRRPLSPAVLDRALAHLLAHHDALRLRFARDERGWRQRIVPGDGAIPFSAVDLSALPAAVRSAAVTAAAASLQASLDIVRGPLVRLVQFGCGEDTAARLLWIVHHLAVDGVSWRILLEDLGTACRQLELGEPIALPPKTTSFLYWAERLREHAHAEATEAELGFWLAQDPGFDRPLPRDFVAGDEENTRASAAVVAVALESEETRALLQDVPGAYNTRINDALLTALVRAFTGWTGEPALLIELEGHGREDLFPDCDLSRTVGWFTTAFPVFLDLSGAKDAGEALRTVKERLRSIPNQGLGYGLLRHLGAPETAARLRSLPSPVVSFNYLGQFDQVLDRGFAVAPESAGPEQSPRSRRAHQIEITCQVANHQLRVTWRYCRKLHLRTTVEKLADGFLAELRRLIAHCQSPDAGGYTPSDFPLAGLDGETLTKLTRRIAVIDAGEE